MKPIKPVIIGEGSYPLKRNSLGADTWKDDISIHKSFLDILSVQTEIENSDFDVRYACIQDWFQRASWHHKYRFVLSLLNELESLDAIRRLLLSIGTARPKDMIYEMSQNTANFVYDLLPQDDDRCLDSVVMNHVMTTDKMWFATLTQAEQLFVIHGLLRLGGGSLIQKMHDETVTMLREKQHMNLLIAAIHSSSSITEEDVKPMETKPLESIFTPEELKKEKDKNRASVRESTKQEQEDKISGLQYIIDDEPEETAKDIAVKEHLAMWEQKLNDVQGQLLTVEISKPKLSKKNRSKSKTGDESIKDKNENEGLDQVQMLPLWANRAIIKNFKADTLNTLKKVNRYWSYMVDEVKKENEVRKFISNTISKLEIITSSMDMMPKLQEKDESGEEQLSENSNSQVEKVILQLLNEPTSTDIKTNIYCGRHHITKIDHTFFHFRVAACGPKNSLLAVTTISRTIIFYSLLTGSLLIPCLKGHTSIISALDFHPDGNHILAGSIDTTIRCWNIWTQSIVKIYVGHQKSVTSLSVSWDYFASCGLDNQVKVFQIWTGNCVATFIDEHPVTTVQLVIKINSIFTGCQDGEISVYDFEKMKLIKKVAAHENGVMTLFVSSPLLLSGGCDGFVRVWNCENFELDHLLSMNHGSPVRSVMLSRLCVLSGDSRGRLCVWSVLKGSLLKTIHTSPVKHCILQLYCIQGDGCDKVVMCGEASLRIYEFVHPPKRCKESGPTLVSQHGLSGKVSQFWHLPLNQNTIDGDKITRRYQRLQALRKRCCTDPKIRNKEIGATITASIVTDAIDAEPNNFPAVAEPLKTFPRVLPWEEQLPTSFNFRRRRKSSLLKKLPAVKAKPARDCKGDIKIQNHKNVLQLYNVYHVSI